MVEVPHTGLSKQGVFVRKDKHKSSGTTLIPEAHKAMVLQRMFEALNLQKYCNENIIYYIWRTPADKLDAGHLAEKKKELSGEIERWEAYLTAKYIVCDEFTMADALFYPQLAFIVRMGYPLEKFPKLSEFRARFSL